MDKLEDSTCLHYLAFVIICMSLIKLNAIMDRTDKRLYLEIKYVDGKGEASFKDMIDLIDILEDVWNTNNCVISIKVLTQKKNIIWYNLNLN